MMVELLISRAVHSPAWVGPGMDADPAAKGGLARVPQSVLDTRSALIVSSIPHCCSLPHLYMYVH